MTDDGKRTTDPAKATKGPSGRPLDNPARNVWITETALATALNVSYTATQLSLLSLVIGVRVPARGYRFHRPRRVLHAASAGSGQVGELRIEQGPEGVPAPQVFLPRPLPA